MIIDTTRVAFLGTHEHPVGDSEFGHPSHEGFAESLNADAISFDVPEKIPLPSATFRSIAHSFHYPIPEYDVYIPGTSRMMYALPVIKAQYPDAKFVYLVMDIFLYGMEIFSDFEGLYGYKRYYDQKLNILLLRQLANRYVDGVVAVSEFAAEFTQAFLPNDLPVRVAHPFIQPDMYDRLSRVSPDLSATNAVFVGKRFNGCKGVDLLVDAWSLVREEFPDAQLTVVGPGHPEQHVAAPGVTFTGYLDPGRLPDVFESASLYVHPARVDTFPISVVEAMHAGLPAVVTKTTGTRSLVRQVDDSMVTDSNPGSLAEQIIRYFSSGIDSRRKLSERTRQQTESFDATTKKREFKRRFEEVLNELNEK